MAKQHSAQLLIPAQLHSTGLHPPSHPTLVNGDMDLDSLVVPQGCLASVGQCLGEIGVLALPLDLHDWLVAREVNAWPSFMSPPI